MTSRQSNQGLTRRGVLSASAGLAIAGNARPALAAPAQAEAALPETAALWEKFCGALGPLAQRVAPAFADGDPLTQLEGIRCLARLLALGFDHFLEHADPRYPSFFDLQTATRKYLGDNPDQTYRTAVIDGRGTYRVRGSVAGAAGVEIGVYAGTFQSGGGGGARRLVASRDEHTLRVADDGSFELTLGPETASETHLQTAADANALLIRTYFWDRALRVAHGMPTIERLDVDAPRPPLDLAALSRGLLGAVAFVDGSLAWWNSFQGFRTKPNTLAPMPDDGTVQTPSRVRYVNGIVELDPSQALVVELKPEGEASYWSFVLQNLWGETPDWRYAPVVRNNRELARDADGRVRVVVAHRSAATEALPNWMDMTGHRRLLLSMRWRSEAPLPAVTTRVVPAGEAARPL